MFSSFRAISAWLLAGAFAGISVGGHGLHLHLHHAGDVGCHHHEFAQDASDHSEHDHHHHSHGPCSASASSDSQQDGSHKEHEDHDCLICKYYLQSQQAADYVAPEVHQLPSREVLAAAFTSPRRTIIESYDARGPPSGPLAIA